MTWSLIITNISKLLVANPGCCFWQLTANGENLVDGEDVAKHVEKVFKLKPAEWYDLQSLGVICVPDILPNHGLATLKNAQVIEWPTWNSSAYTSINWRNMLSCTNWHQFLQFSVDCEWSDYSAWSTCSATCGGGQQGRSKYIQRPAVNGGKECTGEAAESRNCGEDHCPGDIRSHILN